MRRLLAILLLCCLLPHSASSQSGTPYLPESTNSVNSGSTPTPTIYPTRTPAPIQCQGAPGMSSQYCPFPEDYILVRSSGFPDNVMRYSVCIVGHPGLIIDVRGVWISMHDRAIAPMPEAPPWRLEATDADYCERRQWHTTSWPGHPWTPSLARRWLSWTPLLL